MDIIILSIPLMYNDGREAKGIEKFCVIYGNLK